MSRVAAFKTFDAGAYELLKKEFIPLTGAAWIWDLGLKNGVVTASGKLLQGAHQSDYAQADDLRAGLAKFKELPEAERKPPPEKRIKAKYPYPSPPEGGIALRQALRPLYRGSAGELKATEWEPGADFMWLTRAEAQALIPSSLKEGARSPLPASVWRRVLARQFYHHASLQKIIVMPPTRVDGTPFTLTVEDVSSGGIRMRLEGAVLASGHCGRDDQYHEERVIDFEFRMLGYLEVDLKKKAWRRFDVVGLGEAKPNPANKCGCDHLTYGMSPASPGQARFLATAFELSPIDTPAGRTPPALLYAGEEAYFKP